MPRCTYSLIPLQALRLTVVTSALCVLSACPHTAAPPPASPAASVPPASSPGGASGPGQDQSTPADGAAAQANAGNANGATTTSGALPGAANPGTTPPPTDPSLMPGDDGSFELARARLGMSLADVYRRYSGGASSWSYDTRFIPGTHTGTVMAKPANEQAKATEIVTLQDGAVVGFVRIVRENADAFKTVEKDLTSQYGAPQQAPPAWAMTYEIFSKWHKTANEESRFWGDAQRKTVLTAALSATGSETIYMLLDLPRVQAAQAALASAKETVPDEAAPGQAPPPAVPPASPSQPPALPAPGSGH